MSHSKSDDFALDGAQAQTQQGALCWRMRRGHIEVLLITSRDTGRWVIPKGWPVPGMDAVASAAREAWEEAGVEGDVSAEPIGMFGYDKSRPGLAPLPCVVNVFALRVRRLADRYPERKERRRKWFTAAKAAHKVAEPELRALFAQLATGNRLLTAPPAPSDG